MKAFIYYREIATQARRLVAQSDSVDLARFIAIVAEDFEDIADGLEAGLIEEFRVAMPI
jgi:hypothetical protein